MDKLPAKLPIKLPDNKVYNIIIVGTGGTGSHLISMLTQLIAYEDGVSVKLIDGDHVEKKNLKNQKFLEEDINEAKSEVLAERYQSVYPNIKISFIDSFVKSKEELLKYIPTTYNSIPILVGCVDNNTTRQILHSVFMDESIKNMIYIDSGNGTEARIGQLVVGYKKEASNAGKPTLEVVLPPIGDIFPEILADNDDIEKVLSCAERVAEAPQNIATNMMAATALFCTLTNIISFNKINTHITYFSADRLQMMQPQNEVENFIE